MVYTSGPVLYYTILYCTVLYCSASNSLPMNSTEKYDHEVPEAWMIFPGLLDETKQQKGKDTTQARD